VYFKINVPNVPLARGRTGSLEIEISKDINGTFFSEAVPEKCPINAPDVCGGVGSVGGKGWSELTVKIFTICGVHLGERFCYTSEGFDTSTDAFFSFLTRLRSSPREN